MSVTLHHCGDGNLRHFKRKQVDYVGGCIYIFCILELNEVRYRMAVMHESESGQLPSRSEAYGG